MKQIVWYIFLTSTARLRKQCLFKIVRDKGGELWIMWARHWTLTLPHSTQVYKWQTLWYVTVLFILQRIVHLYDVFEIGQHSQVNAFFARKYMH